jgi:hypothetical protein
MASGDEGVLTLSVGVRVSPELEAIGLLVRYNVALNYAIDKNPGSKSENHQGGSQRALQGALRAVWTSI